MSDAVISPPKIDSELTSADADAVASVPETAETLAFAEPVVTIPVPYVKPPLNCTASGGADTVGVAPPACPGTSTRIAYACAVAPPPADTRRLLAAADDVASRSNERQIPRGARLSTSAPIMQSRPETCYSRASCSRA